MKGKTQATEGVLEAGGVGDPTTVDPQPIDGVPGTGGAKVTDEVIPTGEASTKGDNIAADSETEDSTTETSGTRQGLEPGKDFL